MSSGRAGRISSGIIPIAIVSRSAPVLSAVVVSYRSGEAARSALESLRSDAASSSLALEAIAVVNTGDGAEARQVGDAADRVVVPPRNLGYAGGLNAGVDLARGDVLLLANADLSFLPGSVAELADAALSAPLVAAGPAFYSDDGATLLHPPAEDPGPRELYRRVLSATPEGRERLFLREVRRVLPAWEAARRGERLAVPSLRGALLAVSRRAWRAVGELDEGYPLYYEENDWERRLRALGGRLVQATAARVVHRFNQSARTEPRAAEWFARSERRYFLAHFGERGRRALEAVAQAPASSVEVPALAGATIRFPGAGGRSVGIAFSPIATLRPFVFAPVPAGSESWTPPPDVRRATEGATWFVRAFDRESAETLAEGRLLPDPPASAGGS